MYALFPRLSYLSFFFSCLAFLFSFTDLVGFFLAFFLVSLAFVIDNLLNKVKRNRKHRTPFSFTVFEGTLLEL